ncbi:NAD(P)-dependent dehydrogenase (short-subunit alcohol dehydrogenase family) [Actinoplanes tereljensis]|uniref:hypothetical protein n=1 Tax=Paractinoplanes tereljensis TaxID=571912 RepID=UPI0019446B0C|nr:hypothetical protein [Actinoplanes tereljensis]
MRALIVGNSDGIGLALTHRLLAAGWEVTGRSRRPAPAGIAQVAVQPRRQRALGRGPRSPPSRSPRRRRSTC